MSSDSPAPRPVLEDRRRVAVDRLPRWVLWLPLALVGGSLVAILTLPIVVGRPQDPLSAVLSALALLSALAVAWLTARLRSLARHLRYLADEEAALREVGRALSAAVTVEEVVQRVVENAVRTTRAFGAYVEHVKGDHAEVVAIWGDGVPTLGTRVPFPGSLTQAILASGEPEIMTEVQGMGESMAPYLPPGCRGCTGLIVPLHSEDRVRGALVLLRRSRDRTFQPEEASHVRALGHLTSAALRRIVLLQEAERERKEKAAFLDSAAEGVYGLDVDGRCTFINRTGAELLGYSPDELRGRVMHEAVHHSRLDGTSFPVEECVFHRVMYTGGDVRAVDDFLWRKDGSRIDVLCSAAPIRDGQTIVGAVVAFSDITERRQIAQLVQASEAQFRHLAESALLAVLVIEEDDRVVFANPALERILGYRPEEIVGQPLTALMPEQFRERHRAGISRYMTTGERRIRWEGIELPGRHKDGRLIPLEITMSEFTRGGKRFFTGLAQDISLRKAAEAEQERLLAMAEGAVRSRDEVLAIVSHDLRNPLNTIALGIEALAGSIPDRVRSQLDVMSRAVDRMNRLIQDLLDVARLEAGKVLPLELTRVEVSTLVAEACAGFTGQAEKKRQILQCEVREGPALWIAADRGRILQALSNLISNALKFSDEEGRIIVGAREEGEVVIFSVRDSGPGIPAEDRPRVFDLYWQARKTARLGSGLGLAIARGIVEAHGGRIWVDSPPGEGSTFSFSVPMDPVASRPAVRSEHSA
jgi:PAS domain S-box-containing protein